MNSAFASRPHEPSELVLNWHVTEACNFQCRYCFAEWTASSLGPELLHDARGTARLLKDLFQYFHPWNPGNPLRREMSWKSLRLNIAGGEPLLYAEKVIQTARWAREIGFAVSLITNGSRLNPFIMAELAPHLSILGISVDSTRADTNSQIGRAERRSEVLSPSQLANLTNLARRTNPGIKVKVNTVVNALNWNEDMTEFIRDLAPDKWKALQMLPTVADELAVSRTEYESFVHRHNALASLVRVEDNHGMAESYIMIDPHGRFFQNAEGQKGYVYSAPILEVGAAAAFLQTSVSSRKFCSRYTTYPIEVPA